MNGATEQTLSELLAEARRTNANIAALTNLMARMNTGGGGGGGVGNAAASAAGAMAGLAARMNPVGIALSALSAAGSLVTGVFDGLSSIVGKATEVVGGVIRGLVQFSQKAMEGTAKMSDLFASFSHLPFFIGEVSSLFASLLRTGEQYLDVYRKLTQVGADFSGNLFQIRSQASRAFLTLGEFANVVSKNSDIFASMGGNVQSGINKFVELQNGLMKGAFKNQILGLGYTFEEAANATAGFMRSQGTMSKQGLENTSIVRQGVMQYAMELDALSKTTGKQREQIAKELQDLQMEEVWQNFVAQLSPEKADAARSAVSAQLQYGGKEAARSLMLAFQGINVPINEATQAIEVATNGMLTTTNRQVVNAVNSGKSSNEMLVMVAQNNAAMGRSAKAFQQSMGGIAGLLSQQGSPLVLATGQMTYTARQINDILRALGQAQSGAGKQANGSAVAFALAEDKVRQVGAALNDMYTQIVAKLSPNIITLGTSILDVIKKLIGSQGFQETLTRVLNWVNNAFGSLLQSGNVTEFWQRLKIVFTDGFDQLWRWVKPVWENTIKPAAISMFNSIVDFLTPYLRKAFNFVFDTVKSYIYDTTGGRFGSSKETNREISRETEYYESEKDKLAQLQRRVKELDGRDARDRAELTKVWADIWTQKARVEKIYEAMNTVGQDIPGFTRSPEAQKILGPGGVGSFDSQGLYLVQGIKDYLKANPPNAIRALGTLGALGTPTEPKDVVAQLHQGERVLSQGEVGSLNSMGESLQRLNSLTAQLVIEMKENNRHTKGTLDATKSLSGNLYA
jgi:hypothetical protein